MRALQFVTLAVLIAAFVGCSATSPYYVSGVTVGGHVTDTSKDGTVGLQIEPNPYYYGKTPGEVPLSTTHAK